MATQQRLTYGLSLSPILAARQKIPMTLKKDDKYRQSIKLIRLTYPSLFLSMSAGKT